ncbi:transcriptional regulator with XRE-family HTH domain [Anaerospora hongkongensis]|uniref:Transcriptional regulator with XRE-family HTH domain n=1 Tax=Anaerospora hongkongensis TaxID=244830 RepID=A0A4R1Q1M0_9FIRM|nr:helix-turn-helix domain-containing protein [Anaerospora hongkongensis]TCL38218.1 transcriptional regulator with XRE-family HTH domain [Anaerospora hongkongensis]
MALDYKEVGKRLKLVRGRLTQEAFASTLGVSASYVKKTELGGKPSLKYLTNIAADYVVSLDWLLLGNVAIETTNAAAIQPKSILENSAAYQTEAKQQSPVTAEDSELAEMVKTLTDIMSSGDPNLRAWGKIQFRHAFDAYTARKNALPPR